MSEQKDTERIPLKQGLKHRIAFIDADILIRHREDSIKTRIETIVNNVSVWYGANGHREDSIKTRIETKSCTFSRFLCEGHREDSIKTRIETFDALKMSGLVCMTQRGFH